MLDIAPVFQISEWRIIIYMRSHGVRKSKPIETRMLVVVLFWYHFNTEMLQLLILVYIFSLIFTYFRKWNNLNKYYRDLFLNNITVPLYFGWGLLGIGKYLVYFFRESNYWNNFKTPHLCYSWGVEGPEDRLVTMCQNLEFLSLCTFYFTASYSHVKYDVPVYIIYM